MIELTANDRSRFLAKTRETGEGCILWTGALNWGGYGSFRVGHRKFRAHRVAYELFVGPIPEGMQIDHLCRTRHCVNAAHLEVVTNRENQMRGETVSAANAAKTHCIHGHPLVEGNLENDPHGHRRCSECRRRRVREWARRKRAELRAAA